MLRVVGIVVIDRAVCCGKCREYRGAVYCENCRERIDAVCYGNCREKIVLCVVGIVGKRYCCVLWEL